MIWSLALILGLIGGLFLYALMSTAKRSNHQAKVEERRIDPFSDVTVTRNGE